MITLYDFGPLGGLPDASPFVLKTMLLLKLAGLAFNEDRSGYRKAPKGKLPFIIDDGITVPDSTFIRFHIETKYGIDFDAGLDPKAKAMAWAVERMCEDHLYYAIVDMRWCDRANFENGLRHFFDGLPWPLRPLFKMFVIRKVMRAQKIQGMGRHTKAEIAQLAIRDINALSEILGDKPYLMGNKPCAADAAVFGVFSCILSPVCASPISTAANGKANLIAHRDRIRSLYFPDSTACH